MLRFKEKLEEYRRVIRVAVKPTKEEFIASSKITALGVALLGAIGFVIGILFIIIRGG